MSPTKRQLQLVSTIQRRVAGALKERSAERVVVGVSGGADSMCLVHAIAAVLGPEALVACHIDHGLRSETENEWMTVSGACKAWGIAAVRRCVDTRAAMSRDRLSMEEAARMLRYQTLRAVNAEEGCDAIAVGHTADDQAETVLMHVLRGSGLRGLAGMSVFQGRMDGDILRPLLSTCRAETVAYCTILEIATCHDPSNDDLSILRNRVRHDVLPELERVFPGAAKALVRLAAIAGRDASYLRELAEEAAALVTEQAQITPALWAALPEALQLEVLVTMRTKEGQTLSLEEVGREASRLRSAARRPHPSAWAKPLPLVAPNFEPAPILMPGRTRIGELVIDVVALRASPALSRRVTVASKSEAYLDLDLLGDRLTMRAWRPGDRVRPLGMTGTRKLQDIFVDEQIPRAARSRMPILVSEDQILWLPCLTVDDRFKITAKTRRVLHVAIHGCLESFGLYGSSA